MSGTATERFAGHTPGPLSYHYESDGWYVGKLVGGMNSPLAVAHCHREQDAKLFAAAPALLAERDGLLLRVAALEAALHSISETHTGSLLAIRKAARAALAASGTEGK